MPWIRLWRWNSERKESGSAVEKEEGVSYEKRSVPGVVELEEKTAARTNKVSTVVQDRCCYCWHGQGGLSWHALSAAHALPESLTSLAVADQQSPCHIGSPPLLIAYARTKAQKGQA